MALQFHPDKNAAPGASDAFKIIGNAFTILNDMKKREIYDQYGMRGIRRFAAGRSTGSDDEDAEEISTKFEYEPEITPEELFNLFFGGGLGGGDI
jgi:DnaJ-class molecular chaperone